MGSFRHAYPMQNFSTVSMVKEMAQDDSNLAS